MTSPSTAVAGGPTSAAAEAQRRLESLLEPGTLPEDPSFTAAVLERCYAGADVDVAHHAVRTLAFATRLGAHVGVDHVDPRLLFAACVLHDVGLSDDVSGAERFEVAGADVAAVLLAGRGFDDEARDQVWEAIALHTSAGIAERRRAVTRLTRAGVRCDFGGHADAVDRAFADRLFDAFPRRNFARSLAARVHAHVSADERRGPRHTFPGEVHRELAAGAERTEMEIGTLASAWDA